VGGKLLGRSVPQVHGWSVVVDHAGKCGLSNRLVRGGRIASISGKIGPSCQGRGLPTAYYTPDHGGGREANPAFITRGDP
jgi:hypothetical protein